MKRTTNYMHFFPRLTWLSIACVLAATAWHLAAQGNEGRQGAGAATKPEGLSFDGTGTTPEVRSTPLLDLQDELTLEAWVRPQRFGEPGVRLIDKSPAGAQTGYMLDTYPGNSLRFLVAEGMLMAKDVLPPDEWAHVAGVFSASRGIFKLYVNGKEVADASKGGMKRIDRNRLPLRIGVDSGGAHAFKGSMARVTIYNRALAAEEVARLAAERQFRSLSLAGRVADWDFTLSGSRKYASSAPGELVLRHTPALSGSAAAPEDALHTLWYRQPARDWNEALPLGNGRLGAMVFGGLDEERFQVNEDTFWSGRPMSYAVEGAVTNLAEVRRLLFEGRNGEAVKLAGKMMGNPMYQQAYQPLADVFVQLEGHSAAADYRRELDLQRGLTRVQYRMGDVTFTRESFISAPDQVLVVRLTATDVGKLNFAARLSSPQKHEVTKDGARQLALTGQWIGDGRGRNLTAGVAGGGIKFGAGLMVEQDGGVLVITNQQVVVRGANSATLRFMAATSFKNFQDISGDPEPIWRKHLARAETFSYLQLRERHVADITALMDRVSLDLGGHEAAQQPTDVRLRAVQQGAEDRQLTTLYFQLGRYLLASSSRPGTQPANLQGIWNQDVSPAWGSKWTVNINTEMNYWPAEVCNLSECHEPLFDLMDGLAVTGAEVALKHYGARGWVVHHNADLWRGAAPVDGVWGIWPMASAWFSQHPWEHYQFTGDEKFLKERAWPLMKGAARFVMDFLVEAPASTPVAGKLVTNPSHSPENTFRKSDGSRSMFTYAATMDLMIIHDLLTNCLQTIDVLDGGKGRFEAGFRREVADTLERLAPLQISQKDGRLQEWVEDYEEPEPGHRHMSHLFGLHPGAQITIRGTPELAAAARKSLDHRIANGGGGTGWSRAWVVNFYARLEDGNAAHKHLQLLHAKSTLPNLFDTHPPFQIDGNFAGTAGIAEMLVQSHAGEIHLLPALPAAWPSGKVTGLRARGGFEVDITWNDGKLTKAALRSKLGRPCTLRHAGQTLSLNTTKGGVYEITLPLGVTQR